MRYRLKTPYRDGTTHVLFEPLDFVARLAAPRAAAEADEPQAAKHAAMMWAQRLKRVFAIEIEACRRCGGKLKVIASIEDPELIGRILEHLEQRAEDEEALAPFAARAPPQPPLL